MKATALGFRIEVEDARNDPTLQSFILKELSRYQNVHATFEGGDLLVSVDSTVSSPKAAAARAEAVFKRIQEILSVARDKYRKYLELKDLLDTPGYRVQEALAGIPPLEA